MSVLAAYGFETVAEPVTLALIHSIWQGALFAVLLAIALTLVSKKRARLRYALSCAALAATVTAAAVTGWILMDITPGSSFSDPTVTARQESQTAPTESVEPKLSAAPWSAGTTSLIQIDPRKVAPLGFCFVDGGSRRLVVVSLFYMGQDTRSGAVGPATVRSNLAKKS